jgi:uncharacterized protein (DUF2141 family)
MKKTFILFFLFVLVQQWMLQTGCAHIVPPEGGLRDTLPPVPVKSSPKDSALNIRDNKISIEFNEFIQLDNPLENVIVAPYPARQPQVESRLRTLTIRLKDTLLPNTTYNIDFGKAIKDVNEGNILRNYKFVFSTGNTLDSLELSGKVLLAETGKPDSTITVGLYKQLDDSAVAKHKPFYFTRLKGDGSFKFTNLPAGTFALYALKDANGNKQYDQETELFAFLDKPVTLPDTLKPVTLYAFSVEKDVPRTPATAPAGKTEKKLQFQTNLENNHQSLIAPFQLSFLRPLKSFDSSKVLLLDSTNNIIHNYKWEKDSTGKILSLVYNWLPGSKYTLIADKDFATDTLNNQLLKTDTLRFTAKSEEDYGSLRLKFNHLNLDRHPVLQFVQQDKVVKSVVITDEVWTARLFNPGDYELRILWDDNKNGVWDPGKFFGIHRQPERVFSITNKLSIKPRWENENTIDLNE